jgi:rod shape-determining protein MreD
MRWVPFLILVYLVLLVQTTVGKVLTFQETALGTIGPDLAAIVAVFLALRLREGVELALASWVLGLAVDLTTAGQVVGPMPLAYVAASMAVLKMREAFFRERIATRMLLALVFCVLAHGIWVTVETILAPAGARSWGFYWQMLKQALALAIYTAALMPLGHWVLGKLDRFVFVSPQKRPRGVRGTR